MKFEVKMIVTESGREIEYLRSNIKKTIMSKFEIGSEKNSFFTNNKKQAIRIKNLIDKSANFKGKIYCEISGVFLPFPLHEKRTNKYIEEVLNLLTKNKEGQ